MSYEQKKVELKGNVLRDFRNGDTSIHCESKKDAIALCEYLNDIGMRWANGEPLSKNTTYYRRYKSETAYAGNRDRVRYGTAGNHESSEYEVIKFEDAIEG